MDYAEVKIVIDENKITREGKYPVNYIFHHIRCIAKTGEMHLLEENVNEQTGKHTMIYRMDYESNPHASISAAFFANYVYASPAKPYLNTLTLFNSKKNSLEDCISDIRKMEEKHGWV